MAQEISTAKCLRWGIVSAGKISHDFVCAVQTLSERTHEVYAVGARNLESAVKFAEEHKISKAYGSYKELAQDENIDIVYVGAINNKHYDIVLMMIDAGKHVLCEKPLAMNLKQAKAMVTHAQAKGVFFMEAVWSRSFPVYTKLASLLESNAIGDVHFVNVNFGFPLEHVDRVNVKEQGGSAILDIGVYTLQFAQYVFRNKEPTSITGVGTQNKFGVDNTATCVLQYPDNKSAVLSINTLVELPNEAIVVGKNGTIRIPNFWCPSQLYLNNELLFESELPKSKATFNFKNSVGLSYEAEECRMCIKNGSNQSATITHNETLQLATWMETWRKAIGVEFDEDK